MNNAAIDGKWENDIAAFEAADRIDPPPKDAIVFVGSSSIRLWKTLSDDFSGLPVINRGFGGSCMHDTLRYADRIVIPYRPRHVVVYAGDNDIAFGGTVELSSLTLVGNGTAGLRRTGGTVAGAGTYVYGATVTVGAIPNDGFVFTGWTATPGGAAVSTEADFSFQATENRTLWANFQSLPVITLQASPTDGGSVSGAGTYEPGATVTVVATTNAGYNFVNWTEFGYAVSTAAAYSFTAAQNRTLTANFESTAGQTYVVSLGHWPLEGGSISGGGSYAASATTHSSASSKTPTTSTPASATDSELEHIRQKESGATVSKLQRCT